MTFPSLSVLILSNYLKTISYKHLMTGPEGNSEFCFPRISMFLETRSRETSRFEETNFIVPQRNQSLSDLFVIYKNKAEAKFEKRAEIPATTSGHH